MLDTVVRCYASNGDEKFGCDFALIDLGSARARAAHIREQLGAIGDLTEFFAIEFFDHSIVICDQDTLEQLGIELPDNDETCPLPATLKEPESVRIEVCRIVIGHDEFHWAFLAKHTEAHIETYPIPIAEKQT